MTAGSNLGSRLVTEDIREALFKKSSVYNDVVFQCSDGESVAANRMLLAIRSDFFSALFYSGFSEQDASSVKIDMRSRILHQIIEFAYTGTCHMITRLVRFAEKKREIEEMRRCHFDDLVDLIRAADYCQMMPLKEASSDTLKPIIDLAPWTKCAILELRGSEPSTVGFVSRRVLHKDIARDPRASFLVPECVGRKNDDQRNDNNFGVLDLNWTTLSELLQSATDREDFDSEYWFQVIHYWASEGRTVARRLDSKKEEAQSFGGIKWERGKDMIQYLNLYEMRPLFVKEFVQESGLVDRDALFKVYRFHATSECEPLRPRKKRKTGWHVDDGAKPKWKDYSSSSSEDSEDSDESDESDSSSSSSEFW